MMFMAQNDKTRGGDGGIAMIIAAGNAFGLKPIHDAADIAHYQSVGIKGPVPLAAVEFNSYPRIGS